MGFHFSDAFSDIYRGQNICKTPYKHDGISISKPIGDSIISILSNNILGIGITDTQRLYIEGTSLTGSKKDVYQVLFDKKLRMVQLNVDTTNFSEHQIDFSFLYLPLLCTDIKDKVKSICESIEELKKSGIEEGNEFLFSTKQKQLFENVIRNFAELHNGEVLSIIEDPVQGIEVVEDLAEEIIGRKSTFKIASTKFKKKKNAKNNKVSCIKISLTKKMKEKIPQLPEWMKIPEKLIPVERSLAAGNAFSFLQHGPTGGGKTTNVKLICRDIKLPLMAVVNCTNNLDEFVLGKFIPKGNEFVFLESEVTEAIKKGGAVVFEEINYGNPKHMSFLNSLLDDNAFVRLDNGKIVQRHKDFRFFATMNYGYAGTNELNMALYNRFDIKARIKDLEDSQIKNLITKNNETLTNIEVDGMIFVYRTIQKKIEEEMREEVISPRDIVNWAIQTQDSNIITAANFTICSVAQEDEDFEKEISDIIKLKF